MRIVPVVGRQLAAASDQADAAEAGLVTAVTVGTEVRDLVEEGLGSGPERVEALRRLAASAGRGRAAFERLDLGPDRALIGQLASAREEIDEARAEALEALTRAEAVSAGLAEFFEGPNDYLLFAANNSQMQNGQGMFLSAGVLHVEDGRMDLAAMESTARPSAVVPPLPLEEDLAARWGWLDPNEDLRHLGLSHRFPVTAETAGQLWAALGNPEVDGVISVDPHVLEAILHATGPVATPGRELRAADVVQFALHDQYQGYLEAGDDRSFTAERRDELSDIATTALAELEVVRELDAALVDRFGTAAGGRHLLAWSKDPTVQAGWEAAGIDGQITPDSLLLSVVNRSGVKLDWFVRVAAELSLEADDEGYDGTLEVTVTNRAPASGEPAYVVGPYPGSGLVRAEYLGLVTLNLPQGATDIFFEGVDTLPVAGADGHNRTVAAWVQVPRGTTTELVARFRLPPATAELHVEPSGRSHPTHWSYRGQEWRDRERRTFEP